MGIQSSIGLISGIDYTSLVDQLMEIERTPITNLETRNENLMAEETAWSDILGSFLTTTYLIANLNKIATFKDTTLSSSNESLLKVSRNNSKTVPTAGTYTFTPIRTAAAQQSIATGVSDATAALNKTGEITIGRNWKLENDINLSDLNGGDGIIKGYIRITDGSGTRATIDLRSCVTMNDVLDKINSNVDIDVIAELDGNKLVLSDLSGEDPTKFKIQEVSGGKTAASLGLIGGGATLDSVEGTLTGSSIYYLGRNTQLSSLNDGLGLTFSPTMNDLTITTKDGTNIIVDFNRRTEEGGDSKSINELTFGDIIDTINNAENNNGKIIASIGGADGKSLVITDTTGINYLEAEVGTDPVDGSTTYELPAGYDPNDYEIDSENYVVEKATNTRVVDPTSTGKTKIAQVAGNNVTVLRSLGLIDGLWNSNMPVEFEGSVTSRSLMGDLDSSMMAILNGGYGFSDASAGKIEVQDRQGNAAVLDFTEAELKEMQSGSIGNVVKMINGKLEAANIGIEVAVNESKTGLMLLDTTTGAKTSSMIFKDKIESVQDTEDDGTPKVDDSNNPVMKDVDPNIAKTLGLDVDSESSVVNGKNLNKQTISFNTLLSDLNGGKGVTITNGQIDIKDSAGRTASVRLDEKNHKTVGDIINAINNTTNGSTTTSPRILARLNSTGDGIEIIDLAGGTGSFAISDGTSTSKICEELGINKTLTTADADPVTGRMTINGRQSKVIEIEATDTLETIRDKINDSGGNFTASIINDGSGLPYRLMITGKTTGAAGGMNIDLSALGLAVEDMVEAANAVLVYGEAGSASAITLQSKNNTFANAVDGIDVTVAGGSSSPITISADITSDSVKASLSAFVENYNKFREFMTYYTYFTYDDNTKMGGGYALANSPVARQLDTAVTKVLYKSVNNIPGITSLASLGITTASNIDVNGNAIATNTSTGKLTFDETVFDALWSSNKEGIEQFFCVEQTRVDPSGEIDEKTGLPKTTTVNTGWAQDFADMAEIVSGDSGLVFKRLETLDKTITTNEERILFLEERVEFKRQTMLNKFYAMEQAMAKMSASLETVSAIST
ncbi:MAG: flagellar filament capping protein FliD, partial [Planctomycetaceae bacterium]|nr:flagellar filament capping protein FliD [Planctomycetaceae bacterium]